MFCFSGFSCAGLKCRAAWFGAALFAVHPLHVESVAWIIERKDVLSTCFYLLAFIFYLDFTQKAGMCRYGAALFFLVCAVLSKSMTISLPLALLLVLWWKRERLAWRDVAPLLPLALLAAGLAAFDLAHGRSCTCSAAASSTFGLLSAAAGQSHRLVLRGQAALAGRPDLLLSQMGYPGQSAASLSLSFGHPFVARSALAPARAMGQGSAGGDALFHSFSCPGVGLDFP